ncbi:RNA polymerase sigma factor [Actinomadura sp. 9N407]|uniref:RNA polymerase sigma factor n=1 Tax=Actinomadura sp. 9N407 TaxID=3375154 RepID=UPI0037A1E1C3
MEDPASRFTRLYDENYRRVLAYALTHAEPHTAEDIAGETFLIAWRRLGEVGDTPLPWLLGVARNLLRKQRDGSQRRRMLAERAAELAGPDERAAWDIADHVVERHVALAAVAALPERDLEILALVNWHGLAPREAAAVLGCSAPTFLVRLHRARKRLARALDRHGSSAAPGPRTATVAREAAR